MDLPSSPCRQTELAPNSGSRPLSRGRRKLVDGVRRGNLVRYGGGWVCARWYRMHVEGKPLAPPKPRQKHVPQIVRLVYPALLHPDGSLFEPETVDVFDLAKRRDRYLYEQRKAIVEEGMADWKSMGGIVAPPSGANK